MEKSNNLSNTKDEFLAHLTKVAKKEGVEVEELARNVATQLTTLSTVAKAKISGAATYVNDSAHKKPWHFVGAAALLGFLTSVWLKRG